MMTPSGREVPPELDSSSGVREPVELLAEEFLERERRGERPTVRSTRRDTRSWPRRSATCSRPCC